MFFISAGNGPNALDGVSANAAKFGHKHKT